MYTGLMTSLDFQHTHAHSHSLILHIIHFILSTFNLHRLNNNDFNMHDFECFMNGCYTTIIAFTFKFETKEMSVIMIIISSLTIKKKICVKHTNIDTKTKTKTQKRNRKTTDNMLQVEWLKKNIIASCPLMICER